MKGTLILTDQKRIQNMEFALGFSMSDFTLEMYIDEEKTFEKQLHNKYEFNKCMEQSEYDFEEFGSINEDDKKQIQYLREHFDNILDDVEFIKLLFKDVNPKEYIMNNLISLNKNIVLDEYLGITDLNRIEELIEEYKDVVDRIYINLYGNQQNTSLMDAYKTMLLFSKKVEDIKALDLSPMEQVMYVYDLVRDRVYTNEDASDPSSKSRDLTQVVFGDKIVCLGYANIFGAYLTCLGFKNKIVDLKTDNDSEFGHARNVAYIVDPKYDIDGVYYFDATWDSKGDDQSNSYLYDYSHFAKTKDDMDAIDIYDFIDVHFPYGPNNLDKQVEEIIENKKYADLNRYILSLNYMTNLVGGKRIDYMDIVYMVTSIGSVSPKDFLKRFKDTYDGVVEKFNKPIYAETMIKLLNNVRKVEYYQNPDWYPYSGEDMYKTFYESRWNFEYAHLDPEQTLMLIFFGPDEEELKELRPVDYFVNYILENNLEEEIRQVKLTKTLSLVKNKNN